jgi:hypothetical protein
LLDADGVPKEKGDGLSIGLGSNEDGWATFFRESGYDVGVPISEFGNVAGTAIFVDSF